MSVLSYNQIIELFEVISEAHYQIKRFGAGELSEADLNKYISENSTYPVFWATPVSVQSNQNTINYAFNLLFFDIVKKDKNNEQEVLSDTLQIALDVFRILKLESSEFTIDGEPTISPFAGRYSEWVAGWSMELNIQVLFQDNLCDIPYEGLNLTQLLQNFIGGGINAFGCDDLQSCIDIINIQNNLSSLNGSVITGGTYFSGTSTLELYNQSGGTIQITGITSGGSGVVPNLQDVTDVGNSTTNDIGFGAGVGIEFIANSARIREGTTDGGLGGNKGVALICSNAYELKWEAGRLYAMEQDGFTIREVSYQFNIPPTATDDTDKGYVVGSRWILDNGDVYLCSDNTQGAAVWSLISSITGQTTQVLYYDLSGYVTSDGAFTRAPSNNFQTRITATDGTDSADLNVNFDEIGLGINDITNNISGTHIFRANRTSINNVDNTTNEFSGLDIVGTAGAFRYFDGINNLSNGYFYFNNQVGYNVIDSGTQYNYYFPQTPFVAGGILTDPNGDGNLQWALPQNTGTGGGGLVYYLNLSNSQTPYREFSPIPTTAAEQSSGVSIGNGATATIAEFLTPVGYPNATLLPGGIWAFHLHSNKNTNNASFQIFAEVWKRSSGGTETLLFTTDSESVLSTSPTINMQICDVYFSGTPLLTSDRILAKVRATNTSNQTHTITLFTEGNQHYSYATTTFAVLGLTCETLSGCSTIQTIQTNLSNKYDKSGGTISGSVIIQSGLTANTINISTTPTNNNSPTQLLTRNATTGNVEYAINSIFLPDASTEQIYGSGFDGDVALDGTNTFAAFTTKVGSAYTLTRTVYTNNLTISNNASLDPNGFGIYVKDTLAFSGFNDVIRSNGNNGGNGSSNPTFGTGGTSRAGGATNYIIMNTGGAGGNGGNSSNAGGSIAVSVNYVGGIGGSGGFGYPTGNSGVGASVRGTVSVSAGVLQQPYSNNYLSHSLYFGTVQMFAGHSGAGGSYGINAGGSQAGAGGGGGSAPRGIAIFAKNIIMTIAGNPTGNIQSSGGNGGNGGNSSGGNGTGGGGGGGAGGGFIYIITNSLTYTPNARIRATGGLGGAGGTGTGTVNTQNVQGVSSQSGSNGVDGYIVVINPVSGTNTVYTGTY